MKDKLHGKFLLNFLAKDETNVAEIMEAGNGYVVPGIASDHYETVAEAVKKVEAFQTIVRTVSVGLGGGGDIGNWKKVLDIAAAANPGHLNQPFETAAYAQGFLDGIGSPQLVNALVKPTGEKGKIQLAHSKQVVEVERFLEMVSPMDLQSIKFMPVNGTDHLEELIYVAKKASDYGIRGVEPAGGIDSSNIQEIISGVKDIDLEFFMPHIFGSAIDPKTGATDPNIVEDIYQKVEGI